MARRNGAVGLRVQLLRETSSVSYRALRFAAIEQMPELACPQILHELLLYTHVGAGVLANYPGQGIHVWGAFRWGRLLGVVGVRRWLERDRDDRASLWGLYVAPDFRGRGVCLCLMQAAMAWFRQQPDLATLDLRVGKHNQTAIRQFQRFGFATVHDAQLRGTRLQAMRLQQDERRDCVVDSPE